MAIACVDIPWLREVAPVYDPSVRELCSRPYPGHPHGCPNVGRGGCPPHAPLLPEVFDLGRLCYVVYNVFDIGSHVQRLREKHPTWTERQLYCCRYWQGTARKVLESKIEAARTTRIMGLRITRCPEGMGLNVTETMRSAGIELEWPPRQRAVQVAFAGYSAPRRGTERYA